MILEGNCSKLLYEKIVWIKYQSPSGSGEMVCLNQFFEKNLNKIMKLLKGCDIKHLEQCVLTPDKLEEIENEIKRVS